MGPTYSEAFEDASTMGADVVFLRAFGAAIFFRVADPLKVTRSRFLRREPIGYEVLDFFYSGVWQQCAVRVRASGDQQRYPLL